jgi:hypothetical protein
MSILGNPITLGGGGADLNIDFGSTPPTDTSKLWVPLAKKPSNISLQTGVDVGDFALRTISVTDTSGSAFTIPGFSSVADDGENGWLFFGHQGGGTWQYPQGTKNVWHLSNSGVCEYLGELLSYPTVDAKCIRYGKYIYIFGGYDVSYLSASKNYRGLPMIQKYNIKDKTCTVIWRVDKETYENSWTASLGGPWVNTKICIISGKIYLVGGNGDTTETINGVNARSNVEIRVLNPLNDGFSSSTAISDLRSIYIQISAISDKKIAASDSGETFGWLYDIKKATGTKTIPYYAGHASPIASNQSIPMYYQENSFTLSTDGKVYKYLPDVNQFETNPTATITATMPSYNSPRGFNDGNAFWGVGTNFYNLEMKSPLTNNNMIITLDIQGTVWKALNTKDTQASVYPIKVLVGDTDGWAVQKDAYLYDTTTSKWTKLDGSSTYQDMVNALNILGVN